MGGGWLGGWVGCLGLTNLTPPVVLCCSLIVTVSDCAAASDGYLTVAWTIPVMAVIYYLFVCSFIFLFFYSGGGGLWEIYYIADYSTVVYYILNGPLRPCRRVVMIIVIYRYIRNFGYLKWGE